MTFSRQKTEVVGLWDVGDLPDVPDCRGQTDSCGGAEAIKQQEQVYFMTGPLCFLISNNN
jgi:hypothetical protein